MKKLIILILFMSFLLSGLRTRNSSAEDAHWQTIQDAYIYAFPLVFVDSNFRSAIGTKDPNTGETITTNMLLHSAGDRIAADSVATTQPNTDVFYSHALLDLSEDAVVFYKPASPVFCSVQLIDSYINTARVLGSGDDERADDTEAEMYYLLTGPDFEGDIPEGLTRVPLPTNMTWMPLRIKLADGARDVRAKVGLMTLSEYLTDPGKIIGNAATYNKEVHFNPLRHVLEMTPQEYFDKANDLMDKNPPPDRDTPALNRFEAIGVGRGQTFDTDSLAGVAENWGDMIRDLPDTLKEGSRHFILNNGSWTYYGEPTKNFGTEYAYRAYINYQGAAINPSFVAVYMTNYTDKDGNALSGGKKYAIRFEADGVPLVKKHGFWSITAYNSVNNYLIPNDEERYSVDSQNLHYNDDGSLDIFLQKDAPEEPALRNNWIPVNTDGEYYLMFRVYLAEDMVLNGEWIAPDIKLQANTGNGGGGCNTLMGAFGFTAAALALRKG
jgi:hypothetical protein